MKYLLFIVILMAVVITAGCISATPAGVEPPSKYSQQSNRIIEITEQTDSWDTMFGEDVLVVRGLVTNKLGEKEGFVLVTCSVYDNNGVKLGYSNDGLGELANGASARFEVTISESDIKGEFPADIRYSCEAK